MQAGKKLIRLFTLAFIGIAFCSVGIHAQEILPEIPIQTKKSVLDNGLTVLATPLPSSTLVSIYALVKVGSASEGEYLGAGLSHFMEHMLFKGTETRGVRQIPREIQSLGGVINASTGFDFTIYTITVPDTKFDEAIEILSDMLMNPAFDPEELKKEREVVFQEMRLRRNNSNRALSEMVFQTVYQNHPYRVPVIGYEEILEKLTQKDFLKFYHKNYIPNNIVLSVAGNIREKDVLAAAEEKFSSFERGPVVVRNLPQEPEQLSSRRVEKRFPTEMVNVSMAYVGTNMLSQDMFALDVLARILGRGESSRLHKKLFRELRLVQNVNCNNYTPMDQGIFEVELLLDSENKVEAALDATKKEMEQIKRDGPRPEELKKIKRQIYAEYIKDQQTSSGLAYSSAVEEYFFGDPNFNRSYTQKIQQLSVESIRQAARKYLVDERLSVLLLKPQKDKDAEPQALAEPDVSSAQRIVLDNGLTVLLKEDHTFPLVTMDLALNGGTLEEDDLTRGLSKMTVSMWLKGSRKYPAEKLARLLDERGMDLNTIAGKNSRGITFNFLSEDLSEAFDIFEDVVKYPRFEPEEFEKVKDNFRTGLKGREDDVFRKTSYELQGLLFEGHALRFDGLATEELIDQRTVADLRANFNTYFSPNNMVLTVFGDIDPEDVLKRVKKAFGGLKPRNVEMVNNLPAPMTSTREKTVEFKKDQAMVMVGFQGVDFKNPDRYGIEVLSKILGSSFQGRIFTRIRDEFGKSYTQGGGFIPSRNSGLIYFYVITSAEYVDRVRDLLVQIIEETRQQAVTPEELNSMKTYLKGTFRMGHETVDALAFLVTLDELYGLGHEYYQSYDARIDAVTSKDIQRLAEAYLDINKAAIVVTRPKGSEAKNHAR